MTEAPMNPAIAGSVRTTSGNEIVDFPVASEDFLDRDSSSDEETQNKTEQTSAVCRLGLVKIDEVGEDFAGSADVPDVAQHSKRQRYEETGARALDQLFHEIYHQLGVRIVVRVLRVQQPPKLDDRIAGRPRRSGYTFSL
jgi:hypothetical protein